MPVHTLADTEGYLPALAERTQRFAPGTRFEYSNSGYVLLALLAERAAGDTFPALVGRTVFAPAEMRQTAFLRSDRLPGSAAVGYLGDGRTNLLHLPVRGSGDSGAYTTAGDLRKFWSALFGERIVPRHRLVELLRPRQDVPERGLRSGLGFWLHRDRAGGEPRGLRRRSLVPVGARPDLGADPHRARQHRRRRVAGHPPAGRTPALSSGGRSGAVSARSRWRGTPAPR